MNTITIAADRTIVRIPRVGQGQLSPQLFDQVAISDQAFILTLLEAAMAAHAPRMVKGIAHALCGPVIPHLLVSDRKRRLQDLVGSWKDRPLDGQRYPFLLVEALNIGIRRHDHPALHRALLAIAVTGNGYREVVGIYLDQGEAAASWSALFTQLLARGLHGVDLVVSSDHAGITPAIAKHFPNAWWQRNQDDVLRSVLVACPPPIQEELRRHVRLLWSAPDLETAAAVLGGLSREWQSRAPEGVRLLRASFPDAMTILALPPSYRARLRTTRSLDRIASEIAGPQRVIRVFPSVSSAERLIGAISMEVERSWSVGQRYLGMNAYRAWKRAHPSSSPGRTVVTVG